MHDARPRLMRAAPRICGCQVPSLPKAVTKWSTSKSSGNPGSSASMGLGRRQHPFEPEAEGGVTLIFPKAAARLSCPPALDLDELVPLVILLFKWLNCLCPACGTVSPRPKRTGQVGARTPASTVGRSQKGALACRKACWSVLDSQSCFIHVTLCTVPLVQVPGSHSFVVNLPSCSPWPSGCPDLPFPHLNSLFSADPGKWLQSHNGMASAPGTRPEQHTLPSRSEGRGSSQPPGSLPCSGIFSGLPRHSRRGQGDPHTHWFSALLPSNGTSF